MSIERRFNLFNYRFSFRTNYSPAAELLSALYTGYEDASSCPVDNIYELLHHAGKGGRARWTIGTGAAVHPQPSFGHSLISIEASVVQGLARCNSGSHLIHGATVYAPQADLLLSGESGSGKTTLSLALTARGFRVGGDDIAALDPATNTLQPVPRCFHLDHCSAELLAAMGVALPADALRNRFVTPAHLGVVPAPPARIRFVFLLERERVAIPRIIPETQALAAGVLLMQTGRGHFSHREGVDALGRLIAVCKCYRLWSASLTTTVDEVARVVQQETA